MSIIIFFNRHAKKFQIMIQGYIENIILTHLYEYFPINSFTIWFF